MQDSNLRPSRYERAALTDWAKGPICSVAWTRTTPPAYETGMQPLHFNAIYIAVCTGIEPAIFAVTVRRVTNNTSRPKCSSVPSCQPPAVLQLWSGAMENRTPIYDLQNHCNSRYTIAPNHFSFQSVSRFSCGLSFQSLPHFFTGLVTRQF